jgi:hypothetical protein
VSWGSRVFRIVSLMCPGKIWKSSEISQILCSETKCFFCQHPLTASFWARFPTFSTLLFTLKDLQTRWEKSGKIWKDSQSSKILCLSKKNYFSHSASNGYFFEREFAYFSTYLLFFRFFHSRAPNSLMKIRKIQENFSNVQNFALILKRK